MLSKKLLLIFFNITIITIESFAFSIEEVNQENYIQNLEPLQVTGDAIKWEIFAKTGEESHCFTDEEGFDNCFTEPRYSDRIRELDNKNVTLTGFMFPLDPTEKQTNFLIGPYPASCPFNYHASPSEIVEVKLTKPIKFSYDPVTVKGVLSLDYNKETGIFYYLKQN